MSCINADQAVPVNSAVQFHIYCSNTFVCIMLTPMKNIVLKHTSCPLFLINTSFLYCVLHFTSIGLNFVYVSIQSLLRGRFLRNERTVENERSSSMAASELVQLRQRHTVSGLRYVAFYFMPWVE